MLALRSAANSMSQLFFIRRCFSRRGAKGPAPPVWAVVQELQTSNARLATAVRRFCSIHIHVRVRRICSTRSSVPSTWNKCKSVLHHRHELKLGCRQSRTVFGTVVVACCDEMCARLRVSYQPQQWAVALHLLAMHR